MCLTSCEADDQYDIESAFINREWTGDIGMDADNGEPLFSTFTFDPYGFGKEYQYYSYNGALYAEYSFLWKWEDDYNRNLVLDYGRIGVSYMDDVRIVGDELRGTFYVSADDWGFDFTLYMEY
ncbi:MAG: hypothetical protein LUE99_19245 [Bacteroides sp.]|nr:hypothetical protein [Bacteroides sp.]